MMLTKSLTKNEREDLVQFKPASSVTRKAVRQVKSVYLDAKAVEAQEGHFRGKVVLKCIRYVQRACRGLIPSKMITIVMEVVSHAELQFHYNNAGGDISPMY